MNLCGFFYSNDLELNQFYFSKCSNLAVFTEKDYPETCDYKISICKISAYSFIYSAV